MKVILLESAEKLIIESYHFYEEQEFGLGQYFRDSILEDLRSLEVYGGIHAEYFDTYHRLISKRFPFATYYKIESDTVMVYAVIDCRRDPAWIYDQLDK